MFFEYVELNEFTISIAFATLSIAFFLLWLRARSRFQKYYSNLIGIEKEKQEIENDSQKLRRSYDELCERYSDVIDIDEEKQKIENDLRQLRRSYAEKIYIYTKLVKEVAIYNETIAMAELGIYSPHFDFTDSDQFKAHIESVRAEQKAMVSAKTAIIANTDWTVGGSRSEGKKMAQRAVRLSLRAFNNECDAALSNIRWNNANAMEKRIQRAYEQIDKLNETLDIKINPVYLQLKMKELWLTHEYREKQKEERDHKAEMNRLKREEERLLKDLAAAEKDEASYQTLLDKAKSEAARAVGMEATKYEARIAELTAQLDTAHARAERAKSMAEQTRAGHIYVISNIGSFGEGVFKIGMTRRLEPLERVRELGDASVPFLFDVHAIMYCQDAPSVEKRLHGAFDKCRVNRANGRKEFFRVSPEMVEAEVHKIDPGVDFITGIEAQEYFETLAMAKAEAQAAEDAPEVFPTAI